MNVFDRVTNNVINAVEQRFKLTCDIFDSHHIFLLKFDITQSLNELFICVDLKMNASTCECVKSDRYIVKVIDLGVSVSDITRTSG